MAVYFEPKRDNYILAALAGSLAGGSGGILGTLIKGAVDRAAAAKQIKNDEAYIADTNKFLADNEAAGNPLSPSQLYSAIRSIPSYARASNDVRTTQLARVDPMIKEHNANQYGQAVANAFGDPAFGKLSTQDILNSVDPGVQNTQYSIAFPENSYVTADTGKDMRILSGAKRGKGAGTLNEVKSYQKSTTPDEDLRASTSRAVAGINAQEKLIPVRYKDGSIEFVRPRPGMLLGNDAEIVKTSKQAKQPKLLSKEQRENIMAAAKLSIGFSPDADDEVLRNKEGYNAVLGVISNYNVEIPENVPQFITGLIGMNANQGGGYDANLAGDNSVGSSRKGAVDYARGGGK